MANERFKFRAWDKLAEKMLYSDSGDDEAIWQIDWKNGIEVLTLQVVDTFPGGLYHEQETKYLPADVDVMQSTDFKDKNGNLIFEGDVVECSDWFGTKITGKVLFDESGIWKAEAFGRYPDREYLFELIKRESFKIIGNIYEHPHLLTPKP